MPSIQFEQMPATMNNLNPFSSGSSTKFGNPSTNALKLQQSPIEPPTSSTTAFITSSNQHQNANGNVNGNENISKLLFAPTMANNNSASSVSPSSSSPSSSASSAPTAQQQNVGISSFNFLPSFGADLQKIIARNFEDQIRQNAQFNQLLLLEEEEKQRRKQALLYNKTISHEKRKFTPPISDFMVLEVLKRKNYLVEHNTSRDLKFSEEKRKAWETVRDLLKERFAGFTMGIENIKSHWRYRKRKVTDAANEIRGPDIEDKLREKLGNEIDFRIYLELKASNMLDNYDDDSPPMPLFNANNIEDDDSTMNFSNSASFPMQFEGQYQKSQNDQLAQLLKNNSSAANLFPTNVPSPLLDFFKLQQIKQMTDINFNANLPKIDNSNHHPIGQQNGQIMLDGGRKRTAELNTNLGLGQNGIQNGQPPKMHKNDGGIVKEENGDSNDEEEALIIDEDGTTMMECTNQNEGQRKIEENVLKVENAVPMEMNGQINALIQAQIEAANAQKELANLQKSATVEWFKAAKNINELIPKLGAAIQKYMKEE